MNNAQSLAPSLASAGLEPAGDASSKDLESWLAGIRQPVAADMRQVDELITTRLASDIVLINQLSGYLIAGGGKRLRPLTTLLCAGACGTTASGPAITLATVIEFIHTATLLHDDVVDVSDKRRGRDTANVLWGNDASVLVGDFLYSRSFQMMVEVGNMHVMRILADTTNRIAEGEVMQLLNAHSADVDEARYMETIERKTATLFESAAQLGAVVGKQNEATENAMCNYGRHLGIAFQLVDDALDYSGDSGAIGKNSGDDLAEGKPTLPVIQAMRAGNQKQKDLLIGAIENGRLEKIEQVQSIIESTGALAYTSQRAVEHAEQAKQALKPLHNSSYKQALTELADFTVSRKF